jgi:hypothetical protein
MYQLKKKENSMNKLIIILQNEIPRGKQRGISEELILRLAASSGEFNPKVIKLNNNVSRLRI